MNIQFQEKDPQVVLSKIKEAMGDRQLGKMVSFDLSGDEMVVTISKLGTSTLHFKYSQNVQGTHFVLAKEKIALAHRPMKADVSAKVLNVIQKAGGVIQA